MVERSVSFYLEKRIVSGFVQLSDDNNFNFLIYLQGKFQRAISHSGSALSHWALPRNPHKLTTRLATNLGCLPGRSDGVVECLRHKLAKNIVAGQYKLFVSWSFN